MIPVAVAVLIHALLSVTTTPEIVPDSASYMAQAESLARGGEARNAAGDPDTVRTPGYPLFLAAFLVTPAGYPGAVSVQRLLWVLVVLATTLSAYRLTGSGTAALVAGLITAMDLPALQAAGSIVTETPATVFVMAAVWCAFRTARTGSPAVAAMAGLLGGLSAIVRPVAVFIGVPLALAMVAAGSRAGRFRLAAIVVAASLVAPALWTLRNYRETGVVTFSSISSINMLLYRAAGTLAIRDPGGVDANITRRQQELEAVACRAAEARFGRACKTIPIAQRATLYTGLAMPILRADPVGVVMQAGRAFVMIMFGGGANLLARSTGVAESTARMIAFVYTIPVALLAAGGVIYWWRIDRLAASLMLATIGYFIILSLGAEAYSRFRVPFLPFYALLAGGGAAMLAGRFSASGLPSRSSHRDPS